jgi:hypothetical protein
MAYATRAEPTVRRGLAVILPSHRIISSRDSTISSVLCDRGAYDTKRHLLIRDTHMVSNGKLSQYGSMRRTCYNCDITKVIAVTTRRSRRSKSAYLAYDVNMCIAKRALFGFWLN